MTDLRQRDPRAKCPAFLAFLRTRRCCVCGAPPPSQAAHLRMASPGLGKRAAGMGEKPSDRWATPLCPACHLDAPDAQHRVGEARFWKAVGIDPFRVASALWREFTESGGRAPRPRAKKRPQPERGTAKTKTMPRRPKIKTKWPKRSIPKRKKR